MPRGRPAGLKTTKQQASKTPRSRVKIENDDEDYGLRKLIGRREDLSIVNSSQGSDDVMLEISLAEKLTAKKSRKNKEAQKKVLAGAAAQVEQEFTTISDECSDALQKLSSLSESFLTSYSLASDRIRKLWAAIRDEEDTICTLLAKHMQLTESTGKGSNEAAQQGLAKIRNAFEVSVLE